MSVMANKKPKGPGKKRPTRTPGKPGQPTSDNPGGFRAFDPRLLEVLDRYAASQDRSRNYVINALLETALRELGLWPPPEAVSEESPP